MPQHPFSSTRQPIGICLPATVRYECFSTQGWESPMRKSLLSASALVCVALLANSAAEAKNTVTYIPVVPPAGAATTVAWGINDHNVIAGSFTDSSGVEHGFYGPL